MDRIELQKGLNDVVRNKVQRMIDHNQNNVKQTLQRLMSEHRSGRTSLPRSGLNSKRKIRFR